MTKHIHLRKADATVIAPPSKSVAQRVLFAIALAKQSAIINNLGKSGDVVNILKIVDQLGFKIETAGDKTLIQKESEPSSNRINIGESGLGTRLSVPILSQFFKTYMVNGEGTILNRSMQWFEDNLPQTGLDVKLTNQHLPLVATGEIKAGHYTVDGSESSQYISGLLMTLPLCEGDSQLTVLNPTSIPYLDITLKVLADFNVVIEHQNYTHFSIPGNQVYYLDELQYNIEGDFSGAAFWIVYGLLGKGVSISNLNPESTQADKAILEVVQNVGGKISWNHDTLTIVPPRKLLPFTFDATHCPDLFPILTVLAAGIIGQSIITGTSRLTNKESDRKSVILKEFSKLAIEITANDDTLAISGIGKIESGVVNSHNDHRIAMSVAIASMLTESGISISDPQCVNKSYASFWETADSI